MFRNRLKTFLFDMNFSVFAAFSSVNLRYINVLNNNNNNNNYYHHHRLSVVLQRFNAVLLRDSFPLSDASDLWSSQ